eukprot:14499754-Ditylum_brightwellii.AAC.1
MCYHYDTLDAFLHPANKLRGLPLFVEASSPTVRQYACVKYPWNATSYTPNFTGIPPHIMLMSELEKMKAKLEQQTEKIIVGIGRSLVGGM